LQMMCSIHITTDRNNTRCQKRNYVMSWMELCYKQ